jgi:hypothetical protein
MSHEHLETLELLSLDQPSDGRKWLTALFILSVILLPCSVVIFLTVGITIMSFNNIVDNIASRVAEIAWFWMLVTSVLNGICFLGCSILAALQLWCNDRVNVVRLFHLLFRFDMPASAP